jgi:hypothetical protein
MLGTQAWLVGRAFSRLSVWTYENSTLLQNVVGLSWSLTGIAKQQNLLWRGDARNGGDLAALNPSPGFDPWTPLE